MKIYQASNLHRETENLIDVWKNVGLIPHGQPFGPLVSLFENLVEDLVANSARNTGCYRLFRLVTPLSSSSGYFIATFTRWKS